MTQIICIVQIHQLIYKCELCPILHICSTTPFHPQPTHTQVYCLQHSKWQTSLQPPHHFSRGFAPFDRKCSSKSLHHKVSLPVSTGLIIFLICCFHRIHWTLWKHVRIQGESSHNTKPDSRVGLLWILRMWTLPGAQLGGAVTPFSHPQILPQALTVCQWLQRM